MDWVAQTKGILREAHEKANQRSVDELVRMLQAYTNMEQQLVGLVVELQRWNRELRKIVVEKKSFSATG